MLDIKFIRENPDLIKEAARKKRLNFDVQALLDLDEKRLGLLHDTEKMRAKQNEESEKISRIVDIKEKREAIDNVKELKEDLAEKEHKLKKVQAEWGGLMLEVPNVPDLSVPDGETDKENKEVLKWGDIPKFGFEPKNHIELMERLNMLDLERGSKVGGFRGYFLKGDAVMLNFAILSFALEKMINHGFIPFMAPSLARDFNFIGTGWLPQGAEEVYKTQDDLYLAGTSEVPMMGYHSGEVLKEEELPKKYVAFSPCFRREAGSYGKDTKGIYRLHEFFKIEQVVLIKADHQESVKWHEELTQNAREILQELKIPYRVVINCGGDLGLGQVKKYDIEAWIPSEARYRESHSSSYFHDFQTRRLDIRYRDSDGKIRFAHSLNNTAIATPRILISIFENYQQADGTIRIPEVLQKYVGKDLIR